MIKIEELKLAVVVRMEKVINEKNTVLIKTTTRQRNPREKCTQCPQVQVNNKQMTKQMKSHPFELKFQPVNKARAHSLKAC